MRPASTYRLQITPTFDLHAAADVCDYLADLGADAAYLSPILPSARGSDHGYDVIGFDTVDPQRGGIDGWTRLVAAARARHLKTVVDIVPNHTGVDDAAENAAWWDVLQHGRDGEHGSWFDIEWARGRILLPVLGDDFEPAQLDIQDGELRYFEHRFPIAPDTGDGTPEQVHNRQHYELVNWRRADTDQNYRRFFAVTTLAGLRVEDRAVFDATHAQIKRWITEDHIDGLRVDHPDGLADPVGYMQWLRELAGPDAWLLIEKILEHGEQLPGDWPVDGTTGYDALTEVTGVLLDTAAEAPLDALYRELTGDQLTCAEHVAQGKRNAVSTILQAEVSRLARLVPDVTDAPAALVELLVAFPVYRSYLPAGAHDLSAALTTARAARPDLSTTFDALEPRLSDPFDELCSRFQQTSGAVMAKGVEDTAFYRYTRFIALNEVGNDPGHFGLTPADFHAAQELRQATVPNGMTTLSTHDTKRGEDVRARLAVLSEIPDDWTELVTGLLKAAPLSDAPFAYLLWQTFAGVGFIERDRMHAYVEKAMREAATSTTWTSPDEAFEGSVHDVVDAAYDRSDVHEPLAALVERITPFGWTNSLSQKLIQLTMPGIPDVYQGTELWEDSLVDPDNRRAVDYDERRRLLEQLDVAPPVDETGAAKLWVTSRTLRLRREQPELFSTYTALQTVGSGAEHVLAYDRGGAVTVATRLALTLDAAGGWGDTMLELGFAGTNVLTGQPVPSQVALAELLDGLPVALIVR
ncbi:malto-oligosyltrehalose synthase [uncultured Jatrophihabitans sp.]|uniref:malto-oligosyltrehalose synthase n=1 Tax=uncultured Jatrophihabitans sp. TaxID=1610747 RepID=UPI0035C98F08